MAYPPVEGGYVVDVLVGDVFSLLFKYVFLENCLLEEGLDVDLFQVIEVEVSFVLLLLSCSIFAGFEAPLSPRIILHTLVLSALFVQHFVNFHQRDVRALRIYSLVVVTGVDQDVNSVVLAQFKGRLVLGLHASVFIGLCILMGKAHVAFGRS